MNSKLVYDEIMKLNLQKIVPIIVRFTPARVRAFLPIFNRLLPLFSRVFPIFERFVPFFVSYFLERPLRALKNEKSIEDYRTTTVRIDKFHYRIDIRLVVTTEQVTTMLANLLTKILEYSGVINGK
jgi:hypothetical protein